MRNDDVFLFFHRFTMRKGFAILFRMKSLSKPLGAGAGALLLLLANLLSYGAGLFRDLLLANRFGASSDTDAFFAAFVLPDFLFSFLALGFISGALLSVFHSAEQKSIAFAEEVFRSFLTIISLFVAIVSLFFFFFAPVLLPLFFREIEPEQLQRITHLTRILLLSPFLFSLSNTIGMILLARKRFFSMAISPVLYNLGIIGGIFFFSETFGITAAIWGAVIGAFLHLASRAFDFGSLKLSLCPKISFSPDLLAIFRLGIPRTIGLALFQATLFVFAILAAKMPEGSLSAWNFARNIQSLPVSLFGIAFATAALHFLSGFFAEKKEILFHKRLSKSASHILFFALPSMVGLLLVADMVVGVLFEHGSFDTRSRFLVTSVLVGVAVSIPFESLTHLFSRAFLAQKNTLFPALGKFLFFVVTVSVAIFDQQSGVAVFGVAFSSGAIAECFFLMVLFLRKNPSSFLYDFLPSIMRIGALTIFDALMIISFLRVSESFPEILRLAGAIVVGGVFFIGSAFWLRIPEVEDIFLFSRNKENKEE